MNRAALFRHKRLNRRQSERILIAIGVLALVGRAGGWLEQFRLTGRRNPGPSLPGTILALSSAYNVCYRWPVAAWPDQSGS